MYTGQQNYGPWNALADVLGAYWQKKSLDGALEYAQGMDKRIDDATAPKMIQNPVQPEQYGTQAAKKAAQYLVATGKMPNPDWLGQNVQQPADAATRAFMNYVPQGVQAAQPANGSIMAAAQNAIQPTGQNFLQSPAQNAAQALQSNGQMPKLDWLGQGTAPQQSLLQSAQAQATPSATDIANEMAGAAPAQNAQPAQPATAQPATAQPAQTAPATAPATAQPNHPQSIMQAMQDFAARNNPNNPTPAQQAALQKKNADFAAAKAANPQWYEGNWYVGDDKDARAKAKATQAQQAQQKAAILSQGNNPENGRFSSGMEQYGFTGEREKPMSYDQFNNTLNQTKIQTMREIIRKFGVDAAKKAEPLVDSAISDKKAEYGDRLMSTQIQDVNSAMIAGVDAKGNIIRADMSQPANKMKLMFKVQNYNILANKLGKPQYDMQMLTKLMGLDDVKDIKVDTNGAINIVAVKPDGTTRIERVMPKTLNQKDILTAKQKQQQLDETKRYHQAMENKQTYSGGYGPRGGYSGGKQETWKQHYGSTMSSITDQIAAGHSLSYIYTQFCDHGGTNEEWSQLVTPSVLKFYHNTQGDDASEDVNYLGGDGNPEK